MIKKINKKNRRNWFLLKGNEDMARMGRRKWRKENMIAENLLNDENTCITIPKKMRSGTWDEGKNGNDKEKV